MNDSDLEISSKAGKYHVIVRGRANFEYAVPLRNIAKTTGVIEGVAFDLENCTAMDSSFMGVLSMLALRMIREKKGAVELYNAKENLQKLLQELGILKLFSLKEGTLQGGEFSGTENGKNTLLDTTRTVSEAHKALVEADSANDKKFGAVIEYADADVERLSQKDQN